MKILVVYAHPVETSFVAGLHAAAVRTLQAAGHEVDDCDLYGEGFDPVLSRQDRIDYHDPIINRRRVSCYVDRIKSAEALLFIHPVWNFGLPAILKGFFDRVFLPGVSFDIDAAGTLTLTLHNIRRLGAVCTYGSSRWEAMLMGDPPRRVMGRLIRSHIAPGGRYDFLPCYGMNRTSVPHRAAFLQKVERRLQSW